ncbi:hypothetical protein [Trinickia dinghuensis]|uniref:Uncharacterized protein n=1 Tax=Trinickia dinghuensis TaxID=2291023 RepID=A0A3D8JQ38_9BURK|nr:hypothetical protein [Trinickia dinghuensis]RDU94561.1 hypothetical protein DWV00_33315 [Trinickia dinghuensis]
MTLAALLGPTYAGVQDRVNTRPYTMDQVWQQTQRLQAIPMANPQKMRDLVMRFTQLRTWAEFTAAFDLAVPLVATWSAEQIHQLRTARLANPALTPADWGAIGAELTAANATVPNVQQFAQIHRPERIPPWPIGEIVALAQAFNAQQHGMTATQWREVTASLQAPNMTSAAALAFISLPAASWNAGNKRQLALQFQTDRGGLTAVEFAAVATALTLQRATPDIGSRFARMANYPAPERAALATSFNANQAGLSPGEWLDVVRPLAAAHATAANAEAFVRLEWARAERLLLVQAFQAGQQGMSAAEWAALAGALTGGNARVDVANPLIALAAWQPAERRGLAADFQSNTRGLPSAQWAAIAAPLTGARATAATAGQFAALVGWPAAERAALSTAFEANRHGLTLPQWVQLATSLTGARATALIAGHFASLAGWATAEKLALAAAFEANQHGLTSAQCVAIAAVLTGAHRTANTARHFVGLPGWSAANRVLLAQDFIANAGAGAANEWGDVAFPLTDARATVANVTAFGTIARWTTAQRAALARAFNTNTRNSTAQDWALIATQYGGANRALRTERHMAYRASNWPATVNLGGVAYRLRAMGRDDDVGLVYELPTGAQFPHITIHALEVTRSPATWRQAGQDYQVVLDDGAGRTYPYRGNAYSPFPGNPAAAAATAATLAGQFWGAI